MSVLNSAGLNNGSLSSMVPIGLSRLGSRVDPLVDSMTTPMTSRLPKDTHTRIPGFMLDSCPTGGK